MMNSSLQVMQYYSYVNNAICLQTLEMSSDHRRERQVDSEKIRRLTNQLEVLRQEKERCELRIHSLEQQVGFSFSLSSCALFFSGFQVVSENLIKK